MLRARDGIEALVKTRERMVAPHLETKRHYGCLMVNTTIENVEIGSDVFRKATTDHFDKLMREVEALVERALANGTARPDVDPKTALEFVKGSVISGMVLNRAACDVTGGRHM